jgi:hypothetical protein
MGELQIGARNRFGAEKSGDCRTSPCAVKGEALAVHGIWLYRANR